MTKEEAQSYRIAQTLDGCPKCGAQEAPGTPPGGSWWWPGLGGAQCRHCRHMVTAADEPLFAEPWVSHPPRLTAEFRTPIGGAHIVCLRKLEDVHQETAYQKAAGSELIHVEFTPQLPPEWTPVIAYAPIIIDDQSRWNEDHFAARWSGWLISIGGSKDAPFSWECCLISDNNDNLMRDFVAAPEDVQRWLDRAVAVARWAEGRRRRQPQRTNR